MHYIFYSTNEENAKRKTFSGNSLPQKGKMLDNRADKNETFPQQRDSKTEVKTPSNITINGAEKTSESKVSEETEELESQKHKERLGKRKIKEGKKKGKRLTFKEMKELAVKKRLQRQFRGAKKEPLANLSAARLASYGLVKKKKKKS